MDEACRHRIPGGVKCVICTLDAEVARLTAARAATAVDLALALALVLALALALGGCPDNCQPAEPPVCHAGMEAAGAAFERGFGCWNWTLVCAREGAPAKLRELQR